MALSAPLFLELDRDAFNNSPWVLSNRFLVQIKGHREHEEVTKIRGVFEVQRGFEG